MQDYEQILSGIWEEALKYLGVFTVKLLVDRVIYDLSAEAPEVEILECDEAGFNFEKIRRFIEDNPEFNFGELVAKFTAKFVGIIAKLVDQDTLQNLKEKLEGKAF
ncbi:hypothetical protein [Carboxydothermus ferrireducens]|uniref:Nitrosopumilus output domain-containing protein n=1 Tax=Carboxydothermus ferrireducens DSM 11255 TaxID=1119529 RepID=A0ABX2R803_9THEO|nr:hypothetical protein [Carboxydothermus ferrireducens]NYE57304.1 hypothetical protein [Carboxydothermus ferrireducens DSM 11255]